MGDWLTSAGLVGPVVAGVVLAFVPLFIHRGTGTGPRVQISLGVLAFEIDVARVLWMRIAVWSLSIALLASPAVRDYSSIFSNYYDMEVFFDNKGIEESLRQFDKRERQALDIKEGWVEDKERYMRKVSVEVRRRLGVPFDFSMDSSYIHSAGHTTFYVEKTGGWQKYHVSAARGSLKHVLDAPGGSPVSFTSEFVLLETSNSFIEASLDDIYIRYRKVIAPVFKQIIRTSGAVELYHHTLVAATKIKILPVVDVGRTVYLLKDEQGTFVPIGYCIKAYPFASGGTECGDGLRRTV